MNLIVRMKNPVFWITIISQIILLCELSGINIIETIPILNHYEKIVEIIFVVLATLGIAVDPTTKGWLDSRNALGYTKPKDH